MTGLIFVRHGETEWNVREVFRGHIDVELNKTGRKQAELLAKYLRKAKIDAIYSSPLKRALDTAGAIARHHSLAVKTSPGLTDIDFGEWQGLSHEEVKGRYNELYVNWLEHPEQVKTPGGESLDEVRDRAMAVVKSVLSKHEGDIILVSHRVVNKVLICALLGLDNSHFWNIRLDTAGMTTFQYENGRFTLTGHNNTSYLAPLKLAKRRDF